VLSAYGRDSNENMKNSSRLPIVVTVAIPVTNQGFTTQVVKAHSQAESNRATAQATSSRVQPRGRARQARQGEPIQPSRAQPSPATWQGEAGLAGRAKPSQSPAQPGPAESNHVAGRGRLGRASRAKVQPSRAQPSPATWQGEAG
jgi:hypothetical protein